MRAQASPAFQLTVSARTSAELRCLDAGALRERIAHYLRSRARDTGELRLELVVEAEDSAELRVFRGDAFVSRRSFGQLPAACANRRDTVAVSSALALEGALSMLATRRSLEADSVPAREPSAASKASGAEGPAGREPEASSARPADEPRAEQSRSDERRSESLADARPEARERLLLTAAEPAESAEAERAEEDQEPEQEQESQQPEDDSELPARRTAWEGAVAVRPHVGGRFLDDALPSPVWTGVLGVELGLGPRFAIDISGIASTLGDSAFAGARVETRLFGAELHGCSAILLDDVEAQGCLGASLAAVRARGRDYPIEHPAATVVWAAGNARLAVRWPSGSAISARLLAQAHVSAVRPELRVDLSSARLRAGRVGGTAGIDLIFELE